VAGNDEGKNQESRRDGRTPRIDLDLDHNHDNNHERRKTKYVSQRKDGIMEQRALGRTGDEVTMLAFGAAQLGQLMEDHQAAAALVDQLIDAGIRFIDTAACYANSEEKLGPVMARRRGECFLASKCGHQVDPGDPPEWSPEIIRHSCERSLRRLQTDHLDLLLLHTCSEEKLRDEAMIGALEQCKRDGLTRFIGYSGDNQSALTAIKSGRFDCLEVTINFCDQSVLDEVLPAARAAGMGVLAKRTIANACWRELSRLPANHQAYIRPYVDRLGKLGFTPQSLGYDGDWAELALRFTAFQPGVSTAIIGGTHFGHIQENIRAAAMGPLPADVQARLREAWQASADASWIGLS